MSGTSLDGIDTVLCRIENTDDKNVVNDVGSNNNVDRRNDSDDNSRARLSVVATHDASFPPSLRRRVEALMSGRDVVGGVAEIGAVENALGETYASAINALLRKAGVDADDVVAAGVHGQTVWHAPEAVVVVLDDAASSLSSSSSVSFPSPESSANGLAASLADDLAISLLAASSAVRHRRAPFTMQLGDMSIVAARTGVAVVADFRRLDVAYGGCGAPLVPAFHAFALSHETERRAVVNIGGIANVTMLPPTGDGGAGNSNIDGSVDDGCDGGNGGSGGSSGFLGFDTGPGNVLMDAFITHCGSAESERDRGSIFQRLLGDTDAYVDADTGAVGDGGINTDLLRRCGNAGVAAPPGSTYDADGAWASGGTVDITLLNRLLTDSYFARAPPKSTGRELFCMPWLCRHLTAHFATEAEKMATNVTSEAVLLSPQDVQATLTALTARTISAAIAATATSDSNSSGGDGGSCSGVRDRVLICGGGARNAHLMLLLRRESGDVRAANDDENDGNDGDANYHKEIDTTSVDSTTVVGVDSDSLEAQAFAWLAWRRLCRRPGNVRAATGATRAAVLGCVYIPTGTPFNGAVLHD
jgi:anhydro-N-acetylmuramic acid kinase